MRLYWQNLLDFLHNALNSAEMTDIEVLNTCFPDLRFIWITRRDKVRQAISWTKFVQGSAWYWEDEQPQKLDHLVFDPGMISEFIFQTSVHESAWLEFFREIGVQPYIVVYEDFVDAYEDTAKGVLQYLGISYPENLVFNQRRIKKQADALTDEWVLKYLAIYRGTEKMGA